MATNDDNHSSLKDMPKSQSLEAPGEADPTLAYIPRLEPLQKDYGGRMRRGCRFRDLGEAHRNITGRSIPLNSPSSSLLRRGQASPVASSLASFESVALRKVGSITASPTGIESEKGDERVSAYRDQNGAECCLPESKWSGCSASPSGLPTTPSTVNSHHIAAEEPFGPPESRRDTTSTAATLLLEPEAAETPKTSERLDSTVEKMYLKYQAQIDAEEKLDPPVVPAVLCHNGNGAKEVNAFTQLEDVFTDPPSPGSYHRESLLFPMPLRVQSIRDQEKHASCAAVSASGATSDSDDDPFRYDKSSYSIFLHPSKERDVSTALKHVSNLSSHSQATICCEDDTPYQTPPRQQSYPGHQDPAQSYTRAVTPDSGGSFYDTSIIQPNWTAEARAYEVKVVLKDTRQPPLGREDGQKWGKTKREQDTQFDAIGSPDDRRLFRGNLRHAASRGMSDQDDWETVVTGVTGLGSCPLSVPPRPSLMSPIGKVTGDSVADVSDGSNSFHMPFNEYASTDRIVHHPSVRTDSAPSLQFHQVSGTNVPVIIPKHRTHLVNGLPLDGLRPNPFSPCSGNEHLAAMDKRIPNPFRQQSAGCAYRVSPAPMQMLGQQTGKEGRRYEFRDSQSRYEFRDSQWSACQELCQPRLSLASKAAEAEKEATTKTSEVLHGGPQRPSGDEQAQRDSGSSQNSSGTVHSFAFDLIPLTEAARRQKEERNKYLAGIRDEEAKASTAPAGHISYPKPCLYRPRSRSPSRRLAPNVRLAPPSGFTQHQNRAPKIPWAQTQRTFPSSTTANSSWDTSMETGTGTPNGTCSTRSTMPARLFQKATLKLHLDNKRTAAPENMMVAGKEKTGKEKTGKEKTGKEKEQQHGSGIGLRQGATPRLYPWDYQRYWQQQDHRRMHGTDPELREIAMAAAASGRLRYHGLGSRDSLHDVDMEHTPGLPLDPEAYLSQEARRKRHMWFLCMLLISLLPFLSVLVYLGKLDSGLSWYTRGQASRLTARQRQTILAMMTLQGVLWPSLLVVLILRVQAEA